MSKRIVALVVGTRPEAIKLAPVHRELAANTRLQPILLSTGQHHEMLRQTLAVFNLRPDVDLALMQANQSLPGLTARAISAVTEWLAVHRPSALLVQGDTTTALAASLAGFYARIPVGHVEAGLRTYNFDAPWPEEMNRRLVDPICRWCFAPTELSRQNLLAERIPARQIHVSGNTVIDALLWVREQLRVSPPAPAEYAARCGIPKDFAQRFFTNEQARWILVTGHRRESFGAGFEDICRAIRAIVDRHDDLGVVYPVHLNPNVQQPVRRLLDGHRRIALVEPLDYRDFIWMMDRCHFLLSDSGGVQEEAPSLGKPVLVMRTTTERPEGIEAGTSRLVGTEPATILKEASVLLNDQVEYARRAALRNPFGDGQAAGRITAVLERELAGN